MAGMDLRLGPFCVKLGLQVPNLGSKFRVFLDGLLVENSDSIGCLACMLPILVELLDGRHMQIA